MGHPAPGQLWMRVAAAGGGWGWSVSGVGTKTVGLALPRWQVPQVTLLVAGGF